MNNYKRASDSEINYYPLEIFPADLNSRNTVFGGRVLSVADKVAGYVAQRHSGLECVTLLVDNVVFRAPAKAGEALIFYARLNQVWRTSMEIGVKVFAENLRNGSRRHVLSAYFTFVAVSEANLPIEVPYKLLITNEDDSKRMADASERRLKRLEARNGENY